MGTNADVRGVDDLTHAKSVRRAHKAWVVVVCAVLFLALVAVVHCYFFSVRGQKALDNSLIQTVTAFRYTITGKLEWLSSQAELLALDPFWCNCSREPQPPSAKGDEKATPDSAQKYIEDSLANTDGSVLILLDEKKRVIRLAERSVPNTFMDSQVPPELTVSTEGTKEPEKRPSLAPMVGQVFSDPAIDAAFEYAESQSCYLRFQGDGLVYGMVVVPCFKDKALKGALVLAEDISDRVLGECSQGMLDGVLAVVVDRSLLASFDKRTARRPSPALLSSLEEACSTWTPPTTPQNMSPKDGESFMKPETVEVAGRQWRSLAVELKGTSKLPVGWVLFLGDTSSLDSALSWNIWFFVIAVLAFIPIIYLVSWKVLDPEE